MRTLTANAAAEIAKTSRVESVVLVKVYWNSANPTTYSESKYTDLGLVGKLLSVSTFDDVVNLDNSSNSSTVSITLDDTDGSLKQLIDSVDIHKIKVEIRQWFVGLSLDDSFLLFLGEIASPITWSEGDRSLNFQVITRLDDIEVGYSIEEGATPLAPSSAIGKAWPLVFGTVGGVAALQVIDTPSGIVGEGVGAVNEQAWATELNGLIAQALLAQQNRVDAYNSGLAASLRAANLGYPVIDTDGDGFGDNNGLPVEPAEQAHEQSLSYYAQSEQYAAERVKILAQHAIRLAEYNEQKQYDKTTFKIITQNAPQGIPLQFKLGSLIYTGVLNGSLFTATSRVLPEIVNGETVYNDIADVSTNAVAFAYFARKNVNTSSQKFYWVDAGTEIKLTNFPISYIASLGHISITSVYAYKKGVRYRVPPSYYAISTETDGSFKATYITFYRPLSSRIEDDGSTWDGDTIEYDAVSSVGPNVVDILQYLIETYSTFTYDTTSFNHVKTLLTNYPANFALTSRKNIISLLKDIAFQARCSIWLNDNKFFLRYLPEQPTPIETISDEDVVANSLSISSSSTERLVTKFTATWKALHNQRDPYKIIYKYNTIKYGTVEEEYNFYIYNANDLVEVAAQFWLIRKANNFKIIKFKSAIDKLKAETLDPITIDLAEVSNSPVVGIVTKATYNSEEYTIDFEVWVPVRFGEMTQYEFAYPKDLSVEKIFPLLTDPNINTGNPFDNKGTQLPNQFLLAKINQPYTIIKAAPRVKGRHEPIGDAVDNVVSTPASNVQVILDPRDVNNTKPSTLLTANDKSQWSVQPVKAVPVPQTSNATYPGFVKTRVADNEYIVSTYLNGLTRSPTDIHVKQFSIRTDEVIPENTPAMVVRLPNGSSYEFVMQVPTFADNQT